jgi:predicted component of type VI protein secretion system
MIWLNSKEYCTKNKISDRKFLYIDQNNSNKELSYKEPSITEINKLFNKI